MELVVFDKDGTLVHPMSGEKFVQSPDDQKPLPGVKEQITELARAGVKMAIASNQGGVAAGHKTLDEAIAEMRFCLELFPEIEFGLLCPDFEGEECWMVDRQGLKLSRHGDTDYVKSLTGLYRKPDGGMLLLARRYMEWFHCGSVPDFSMVGDREEDQKAAIAAGANFISAEVWREGIPRNP